MRHLLWLLPITILLSISCENKKPIEKGTRVVFQISEPIEDAGIVIESIGLPNVESKRITMGKGKIVSTSIEVSSPTLYQATIFERQSVNFILSPEDKEVKISINRTDNKIEGSEESKRFLQAQAMLKTQNLELESLNNRFIQPNNTDRDREAIQDEFFTIREGHQKELISLISTMDQSIVPLLMTQFIDPDLHFAFYSDLEKKSRTQLPNSPYAQTFSQKVESMRKLAVGSPAPEIDLPNPNGENIKLSSFKGKHVLIDFWASWCKPCRKESPRLVRLYQQHKNSGFEIFSVSLDRKKLDWEKAIKKDLLKWTHVSDLKYFNSIAAAEYKIEAIPATYLVDPTGVIIAKNLRGAALEKRLGEIFQ